MKPISTRILRELRLPKTDPSGGHRATFAATMSMPKAAMNEDDFAMFGEDKIRTARQRTNMQTKPVAQTMHERTNDELGTRVFASHGSHDCASFSRREYVQENSSSKDSHKALFISAPACRLMNSGGSALPIRRATG